MRRIVAVTLPLLAVAAWGQSPPSGRQMTARELFYASSDTPAKAAPAAPAAKPAAVKPAPVKTAKSSESRPAAKTAQQASAKQAAAPREQPPAVGQAGSAAYVPAAYSPAEKRAGATPLGLRYTILKLVGGRMTEVAPDSVFRAGDRIQVSVEANDGGYLYIVHQGTSGTWKPLFPSPEVEEGNNRIERARTYVMPPKSRFYFDEQAGEEKLFIVLSRRPEPDLEKLVYKLQGTDQPAAAPASPEPAPKRNTPVMLASVQIDNSLVGRLRNVYARDLVVEKVDDDAEPPAASGGRREKAVYVVNPSGSPDSRVVADVRLTHK